VFVYLFLSVMNLYYTRLDDISDDEPVENYYLFIIILINLYCN